MSLPLILKLIKIKSVTVNTHHISNISCFFLNTSLLNLNIERFNKYIQLKNSYNFLFGCIGHKKCALKGKPPDRGGTNQ